MLTAPLRLTATYIYDLRLKTKPNLPAQSKNGSHQVQAIYKGAIVFAKHQSQTMVKKQNMGKERKKLSDRLLRENTMCGTVVKQGITRLPELHLQDIELRMLCRQGTRQR
jgi:hypothetical protein